MKPFFETKDSKITLFQRVNNIGFNPHFHNYIELVYLTKGKCTYTLDGESGIINEKEFFIAFPNQVHSYTNEFEHEGYVIIFSPDIVKKYKDSFYSFIPKKAVGNTDESFEKLLCLYAEEFKSASEDVKNGYLCALLPKVFEMLSLEKQKDDKTNVLKSVIKYCKENYKEDVSLERVAEGLNISKYYLSHIFSDRINISFKDYINSLRVEEAEKLLEETDMSVAEISEICGFNTTRTFNRAFKKINDESPTNYRKN